MKKIFILVTVISLLLLTACGSGPSGFYYRYNPNEDVYKEDCFEFSGSKVRYHEGGEVYICDCSIEGEYVEISLDYPGNPLHETFVYNKDEETLTSAYDVFKLKSVKDAMKKNDKNVENPTNGGMTIIAGNREQRDEILNFDADYEGPPPGAPMGAEDPTGYTQSENLMYKGYLTNGTYNEYIVDLPGIYMGMDSGECFNILSDLGVARGTIYEDSRYETSEYQVIKCGNNLTHIGTVFQNGFNGNDKLSRLYYSYFCDDQSIGEDMFYSLVDYFNQENPKDSNFDESPDSLSANFYFGAYEVKVYYSLRENYWGRENQEVTENSLFKLCIGGPLSVSYTAL